MQVIRVHDYGASDVLTLETRVSPDPQPNEVLIRVQAARINVIQKYPAAKTNFLQGYES